jgi:hypothetical protein
MEASSRSSHENPSYAPGQMEPRYQSLMVALVPQPRQMPPPGFDKDELQRIFSDVIRHHSYQSFEFIFDGRGAQFSNGENDLVELRPALLRVQAKMDGLEVLPAPSAAEKAERIFKIASERLQLERFLQCAIQVVAFIDAPSGDAQAFVAEHLLKDGEQAKVLGPEFFGGGVRFRRLRPLEGGEDSLSIEPSVHDNSLVFLEYQVNRSATASPLTLPETAAWTSDALDFLAGPTIQLLSS